MAHYGRRTAGHASPLMAGKRADGQPLQGHQHTHYLPTDEDGDGLIDHLNLWTPIGLGLAEVEAALVIEQLVGPERPLIHLALVGYGGRAVLPPLLRGPAQAWRSHTPYIITRHPKRRRGPDGSEVWIDTVEEQVCRDLAREGLGQQLVAIQRLPGYPAQGQMVGWGSFGRARAHRPPPIDYAAGYELVFAAPVTGPITLGYGRHFGLGVWSAAMD